MPLLNTDNQRHSDEGPVLPVGFPAFLDTARSTPASDNRTWGPRLLNLLTGLLILAGCLPLIHLISILFSTGSNCVGNDHVVWIDVIDKVLSGNYNWLDFPRDTFVSAHCALLPIFIQVVLAASGLWSVNLESLIGIAILLAAVFLQWDALSQGMNKHCRGVLLATLLAINFGTTQMSSLVSGFYASHHASLSHFGLSLGIWSLIKFSKHTAIGATLCGIGSVIATYSFGIAVPLWSALAFTALCQGFRKPRDLVILAFFGVVSTLPYFYFFSGVHSKFDTPHLTVPRVDLTRFVNLLGRPLTNNMGIDTGSIAAGELAAIFGMAALALMLIIYFVKRLPLRMLYPALAFILYGTICSYMITAYRSTIAPWYAMQAKFFWIGIVSIAFLLVSQAFDAKRKTSERLLLGGFGSVVLSTWLILFLATNRTFEDKAFYLYSRTPASAAYTQNYLSAPTFGEGLLFLWDPGNQTAARQLCSVLSRHRLLCFGSVRQATLQGDYFLHTVTYDRHEISPTPNWVIDRREDNIRPWRSFLHLNLCIQAPQRVNWTISIPASATNVQFHTACATSTRRSKSKNSDTRSPQKGLPPVIGQVTITSPTNSTGNTFLRRPTEQKGYLPIDARLDQFAGSDVTISFSSNEGMTIFEFPTVTFNLGPETSRAAANEVRPENTDTSPFFVKLPERGVPLISVPRGSLHFDLARYHLRDFSDLYFKARVTKAQTAAVLNLSLSCENHSPITIVIPLLEDQAEHGYTYPLKLIELPAETILRAIDIEVYNREKPADVANVTDVRLIKRDE